MMNILYILQQSIYNSENKWSTADSNIQMMRGLLRELITKTDWKFYILIGRLEDFFDIQDYSEIFDHENVKFIPYNFPVDTFLNRQHFDIFSFDQMFSQLPKIDVIWNNITEISRNIKTYLQYKNIPHKLISSCYWLDCPEINEPKVDPDISYQYRQFDGFECSDLVSFTCNSAVLAWLNNSLLVFNKEKINKIVNKVSIFDFGFSYKEADSFKVQAKSSKKLVLFLNRLSGINYTHHEEFIKAVNQLARIRNDFRVIFTNPSQKFSQKWLQENVKNIYTVDHLLNRREYFHLLWKSKVSVHLFDTERYGGCSNVESIHCNNIVIMPEIFEYEKRGGENYPFYVKNYEDDLLQKLDKTLDDESFIYSPEHKGMKQRNLKSSSFEFISDKVIKNIRRLFNA